jgi:hypothetical protein
MSRSRTYRAFEFTQEQLAEMAHRHRRERLAPVRDRVRSELRVGLRHDRALTAGDVARLDRSLERASTIEELRQVAVDVARTERPKAATVEANALAALAGARFDLVRMVAELDSIERAALGLDVELPIARARDLAARASGAIRRGQTAGGQRALDELRGALDDLDRQLDDALAEAECRKRTIAAVVDALAEMGFAPTHSATDDGVVIFGQTTDGRTASVKVGTTDDSVGVMSTFTDPVHAVQPGDKAAQEICEPAVLDQAAFHRKMAAAPGLSGGAVRSASRPTRSARGTADGAARRWRRESSSPPPARRLER